jgi:pimeloyl-ACP methyl ester carboxylesterase
MRIAVIGLALAALSLPLQLHAAPRVLGEFQPCQPAKLPEPFTGRAECATLTVPENRAAPRGRRLELPVLRIAAAERSAEPPLFVLNGGPGGPNLARVLPLAGVARNRDTYYIGYRGADGASPLQCPEITARFAAAELLSPDNLQHLEQATAACARRLAAAGIDVNDYTILDVIDDLEDVRKALGERRVSLLSISYGTRVAQFYARRHPRRIHRSVMLGTNPPGHFVFSARVNDQVLGRLSELCAADSHCAARTPDLRRTLLRALQAGAQGSGQLDDGKTNMALFFSLYGRGQFRPFLEAAVAAEAGDLSKLQAAGQVTIDMSRQMIWGDLLAKGSLDSHRYAALAPTFGATAESMGSPSDLLYQSFTRGWPQASIPEEYHRAVRDETPTLLINGDIDVATPLTFVREELLPHLPNGQLVVLKDYGHSDFSRQGPAVDQMVASFLTTGTPDRSGLKEDPYRFNDR